MVTFRKIQEDEQSIVYWYFPEGKEDKGHGTIVVDKINTNIDITEIAPGDFTRMISIEELNEMAEAINQMERESGGTDFAELATEPERSIFYGDHAVHKIVQNLQKGIVLEKGAEMWY